MNVADGAWTTLAAAVPAGLSYLAGQASARRRERARTAAGSKRADTEAIEQARITYQAIVKAQTEEIARVQAEAHEARVEAARSRGNARQCEDRAEALEEQVKSLRRIVARMAAILREHHIDLPIDAADVEAQGA